MNTFLEKLLHFLAFLCYINITKHSLAGSCLFETQKFDCTTLFSLKIYLIDEVILYYRFLHCSILPFFQTYVMQTILVLRRHDGLM